MEVSEISLSDIKRILMGEAPFSFLLEVVIRTLIIYFVLLVAIRLMGKRMTGQQTLTEMAVMIGLGAIISIPAQTYDRGILQGALLLVLVLGFQRGTTLLYIKNHRYEKMLQGNETLLVKNGVIQVSRLNAAKITREQLFAVLRNKGVTQLGQVKRLYQEASGLFSVYTQQAPKPGLSILPGTDKDILQSQSHPDEALWACCSCGNTEAIPPPGSDPRVCKYCGRQEWELVVL
ncbi:YetF domain-containing protein [uncultured Chitinophaga sp.]|jgi:Predicted membrane protein|uniref:DUF421 domain-containing protein n=1 Tax=uncultured Chitinophaga sp. TaxID=339340 RepID=UPI00260E565E|nr:YetF domain-containing protein [uncultured Chitinophaga sp.]